MRPSWKRLQYAWRAGRHAWVTRPRRPRLTLRQALAHARGEDGYIIAAVAVIAVVAAAASAYAVYEQGETQKATAKYNAKIAEQQAVSAQQVAKAQADQQRQQSRRLMAANRAATGASGISDVGSPLLLEADNVTQAELNARMTEYGGLLRQQGYQSEIPLLKFQARRAGEAGTIGAGATLLSGVASAGAGAYGGYQGQQAQTVNLRRTAGTNQSDYGY
jgi:hypothetical protein